MYNKLIKIIVTKKLIFIINFKHLIILFFYIIIKIIV